MTFCGVTVGGRPAILPEPSPPRPAWCCWYIASTVLRASKQGLQATPDADWHNHLSDVLAGVFRLICHNDYGHDVVAESSSLTALKRAATTYISRNLHDP